MSKLKMGVVVSGLLAVLVALPASADKGKAFFDGIRDGIEGSKTTSVSGGGSSSDRTVNTTDFDREVAGLLGSIASQESKDASLNSQISSKRSQISSNSSALKSTAEKADRDLDTLLGRANAVNAKDYKQL